jgi:elongator complex protein 4
MDALHKDLGELQIEEQELKHPGIRPSTLTSQPTVSTGSNDLDKILGHQGLPLGQSLLVEESGTTDFAGVLMKSFASQGIVHNRLDPKASNTHIIVVSLNTNWSKELPGLYKGSSRDQKKNKVLVNERKVSVQNLIDGNQDLKKPKLAPAKPANNDLDLKIAWRYGLKSTNNQQSNVNLNNEIYKDFNHQFDITSRLVPTPNQNEITFIPIQPAFKPILAQIERSIKQHPDKIIRLIIPSLLNPSMYPPQLSSTTEILPFVHSLRSLTRKFQNRLTLSCSLSLELFPRDSSLTKHLENLFDTVLHLEPFDQEMLKFLEKAYSNQPTKVQHGLVHLYKIPNLSEKGQMLVMKSEFAFKNGKKKFEIEEWGIPIDDEGDGDKQTTQNIEF